MSEEVKSLGNERECPGGQWMTTIPELQRGSHFTIMFGCCTGNEEQAIPTPAPGCVGCGRIFKRTTKEAILCG